MGPPRALGWGVGGGAMRKHVPAERMNELKHVPAKLGESKLGSTATTRRVKQSVLKTVPRSTPQIKCILARFASFSPKADVLET